MDSREKRMVHNEALFRQVNERVDAVAESHGVESDFYEYLCECANRECTLRLQLGHADYERGRSDSAQFFIRPEHAAPEIETVVEKTDHFWIVRKEGEAAEYLERLDPRSRSSSGPCAETPRPR